MGCIVLLLFHAVLWGIAIGLNHYKQQERTPSVFIIVDLLAGVAFPFLAFAGGVFMAIVLDFITYGAVDPRKALPHFLQSVKFKQGEKCDYWVIEEMFYYSIKKRSKEDRYNHGFLFSCYPNLVTWILVAIVGVCVNLAVSHFAGIAVDKQISVQGCDDPRIDRTFSCFNSTTLAYVDCVLNENVERIHCFKFYKFGVTVDLIQTLATSYAFFLVVTSVFSNIFHTIKVLLHLSKSRVWGVLVLIFGSALLLLSLALFFAWLIGYSSDMLMELPRLDIISLAQFVMVSLFVMLVGLLVTAATWAEKIKQP